jgi:hypothetical protein
MTPSVLIVEHPWDSRVRLPRPRVARGQAGDAEAVPSARYVLASLVSSR